MIFQIYISVVFLVLFQTCSSKSVKDEQNRYIEEGSSDTSVDVPESSRANACIQRFHDCTNNIHGCSRGKIFKDKCVCFNINGKDQCSCQQPWFFKILEDLVGEIPYIPGVNTEACIPKYHDCTNSKVKCCNGTGNIPYECKCYGILKDDGTDDQLCGCVNTWEHQALVPAMRLAQKFYGDKKME